MRVLLWCGLIKGSHSLEIASQKGKKLPHWWQGVPKSKGKASGEEEGEGEGEGGLHWRLRAPGPAPNPFSIRSGKARTGA